MERFAMRVRAPFAAFRPMQAGGYRATLPTIPPSAAYGLLMNLAAMQTRAPGDGVTTLIRPDLPAVRLAIGTVGPPAASATLYQQLHTYPVGASGKEFRGRTRGAKYWITTVRRALLVGFDAVIAVETPDTSLPNRVEAGLRGVLSGPRYGLPFAGDNSFLFDDIVVSRTTPPAQWYARIAEGSKPRRGSCRLTVGIDREDSSRTTTVLVAPESDATAEPPESAWFWTPQEPS